MSNIFIINFILCATFNNYFTLSVIGRRKNRCKRFEKKLQQSNKRKRGNINLYTAIIWHVVCCCCCCFFCHITGARIDRNLIIWLSYFKPGKRRSFMCCPYIRVNTTLAVYFSRCTSHLIENIFILTHFAELWKRNFTKRKKTKRVKQHSKFHASHLRFPSIK